jgi:hypothetical protein
MKRFAILFIAAVILSPGSALAEIREMRITVMGMD